MPHPSLRRGDLRILGAAGDAVAFERRLGDERIVVAINAGEEALRLEMPASGEDDQRDMVELELPWQEGSAGDPVRPAAARLLALDLAPRSGRLFRLR